MMLDINIAALFLLDTLKTDSSSFMINYHTIFTCKYYLFTNNDIVSIHPATSRNSLMHMSIS